ncbi:MAG: DUF885 domain-containing protein [Vicinamibacterales bacterium]
MSHSSHHVRLGVSVLALLLLLTGAPSGAHQAQAAGDAAVQALAAGFTAARAEAARARAASAASITAQEAAAHRESDAARAFLPRLDAVDPATLSHQAWATLALMRFETTLTAEADRYFWYDFQVTPYSSPLRSIAARFAAMPVDTAEARLAYLDALADVPATISAYEARLRGQRARGIVVPAPEIDLVVPFVRALVADPPSSAFAVPAARLARLAPADRETFAREVDEAIGSAVVPAIERLASFLDGPYRRDAPAGVGVAQYPGGAEYYRFLIRRHTGLDLEPEAIHQIGLKEVARLNGELERVRVATGFAGTLPEFRTYLKTDPRFFPKTGDEIGEAMMAAIRRIEPKVGAFFTRMPKAPYGVLRLDPALEASMTYGYYQLPTTDEPRGLYRFNGSNPESRSLLMAAATIYHELVPGHHFQLALRDENTALTGFRKTAMYTTFTEGWAEYASDLAGEMGMYDDPYARAGRLAMDLFLSSRLVVDTGMNALGWSRDRAIAYMRENTFESDLQLSTETLRYSTDMPGQALAYKLGALRIHEIRDRLTREMGPAFDLPRFHAFLLDAGSLPLSVLDDYMTCFRQERHQGR